MVRTSGSLGGALDADLVALLDDREPFARLEAELLLVLRKHVLGDDQRRAHRERSDGRADRRDGCAAADIRALPEGRDHQIDEAGEDDADADHDELVLERRPRVGPEKGAQNDGKRVEKPETDNGFHREWPVGKARSGLGVRHHEHLMGHRSKTSRSKQPLARWQKRHRTPSKRQMPERARAASRYRLQWYLTEMLL